MRYYSWLMVLTTIAAVVGCAAKEEKPSYADLVVIYNAESETLERLERKRATMIAEYEATLAPSGDAAMEALSGMLGDMKNNPQPDLSTANADELLDNAIANAENLDAKAAELLEAAAKGSGKPLDREAIEAMYSDEFKAKLAEIDAEIADQRARVEKAKADRDAAQAE